MAPNIVEKIADALHLPGFHGRGDGAEGATSATTKPIFDNEKVTVIFVLGGPGAGSVFLSFPPLSDQSPTRCRSNSSSSAIFLGGFF